MGELGPIKYFTVPAILWLAGKAMCEVGAHKIFNGASNTVVGWHDYVLGQTPIRYFREPAIMWLAGTVMCKIGAHNVFHGASINVFV